MRISFVLLAPAETAFAKKWHNLDRQFYWLAELLHQHYGDLGLNLFGR
jgi:hypothetical protein